ncbi:tenascin-like [Pieris brassicae]|uniref:tenascin-like n=1 Tax=Pieris brassicae TaxID=7116 RepID=UPI001E660B7F|nr:tenascin-like [Pieris brassicae]
MDKVVIVFVALIHVSVSLWTCTSDLDCSSQAGSVCVAGSCQCPAGQEAISTGTRCVGVAPYHTSPCFETNQCSRLWINYECRRTDNNTEGTCECMEGNHYFLGRCWRSRDYRETCQRDEECITTPRDPYALKCDGVCVCADGYYERQRGECRKIGNAVGDGCVVNEDCHFPDAVCDIRHFNCTVRSDDRSDTLNLNELVYFSTEETNALSDREVESVHNTTCTNDSECDTPATCTFGACVCPTGFYRYNGTCYAELGTPSTPEQCDGILAVVIDGICSCPPNFFYHENMRSCIRVSRRLTDSCMVDAHCHTFGAQSRCGAPREPWGLRSCECITENAVWDQNRNICRLFAGVGEGCEVDNDCLAGELQITCVKNEEGQGFCSCPPHLTEFEGLCLTSGLVLGDDCQATPECNGTQNSICTNNKCSCAEGFQQEGDYCAPVIGGPCTQDTDCVIQNTECRNTTDGLTCQCHDGLVGYEQQCYTVSPGINASCTVSAQCKATMGETVDCVDGLCACIADHHYRDGRCWRITGLFESCSRTSECYLSDMSGVVSCRNGRCQCDFDHPYSETLNTCVSSGTTIYGSLVTILTLFMLINI